MNHLHPHAWLVAFVAIISYVPWSWNFFPSRFLGFQRAIPTEQVKEKPGVLLSAYKLIKPASFAVAVYVSIDYGRGLLSFWLCVILLMVLSRVCLGDSGEMRYIYTRKGKSAHQPIFNEDTGSTAK